MPGAIQIRRRNILRSPPIIVSPAFTPASLTNLVAWYAADSGVTTSVGNVTQVLDKSGNGYTLTNSGTVPFTASSAFNSHPAFGFVAANNAGLWTGSGNSVVMPSASALSVFVVTQVTSSSTINGRIVSIGNGANPDYGDAGNIVALSNSRIAGPTSRVETYYNTATIQIDDTIIVNTNYRLGVVIGGGTATHYVNNVGGASAAGTIALGTPTNIVIGTGWAGGGSLSTDTWDGPVLEIVIAASALSSADRNNLDTYFTNKWGT